MSPKEALHAAFNGEHPTDDFFESEEERNRRLEAEREEIVESQPWTD